MATRKAPDPVCVLRGHTADVQTVAFSSTTEVLYTGDAEGNLIVWSLTEQRPLQRKRLHSANAGIIHLQVADDCKQRLISQGRDGTIVACDLDPQGTVASEPTIFVSTGTFSFCRFSLLAEHTPGTGTSAPATQLEAASACEPETGSKTESTGHSTAPAGIEPRAAVARQTIGWLASADTDPASIAIWDLQSGAKLAQLRQPEGMKCGMCMAVKLVKAPVDLRPSREEAGQALPWAAAAYEDGTIAMWDTANSEQPMASARLHNESAMCIDHDPAGGVSGAADDQLVFFRFDPDSKQIVVQSRARLKQPGSADIAMRSDRRIVAAAGWDGKIRMFHREKHHPLAVLQYHRAGVTAICFSKTNSMASVARDGTIALWSIFA